MRRDPTADNRRGVTLLEVMAAATISAALMASSMTVIRSSYAAWLAHEADMDRATMASAVLRHVVQATRQATSVSSVSGSGDTTGALAIQRVDGSQITWALGGTQVTHQLDAGSPTPLAGDITALEFIGYEADGATETTNAPDVRSVDCLVTTDRPAGGTRTVSSRVWLRAW